MSSRNLFLSSGYLVAATVALAPRSASAFTACTASAGTGVTSGHWPDPRNAAHFGSQKWDFDWQLAGEAIEVSNVKYTSDLTQPKKMVMRRGSVPFLPVHYPDNAPSCPGSPHGYSDHVVSSNSPMCCAHVPSLVCNEPDRVSSCSPRLQEVSSCPSGAPMCTGVCLGTQVDTVAPTEDGIGELVSGSSSADVVLTGQFRVGLYVFEQRWRFQDDGTILPSLRAGGVHDCQFHTHQIYFRFNFELGVSGPGTETTEICGPGGCPDLGTAGWSTLTATCGSRPTGMTEWRTTDATVPGRAVIIQTASNEGIPANFCDGASNLGNCPRNGGQCLINRDFCALPAAEPDESLTFDNCDDGLQTSANGSSPSDYAFWYMAHVDHHDPCSFLPMCDPALGTLAFGPKIRAVGF